MSFCPGFLLQSCGLFCSCHMRYERSFRSYAHAGLDLHLFFKLSSLDLQLLQSSVTSLRIYSWWNFLETDPVDPSWLAQGWPGPTSWRFLSISRLLLDSCSKLCMTCLFVCVITLTELSVISPGSVSLSESVFLTDPLATGLVGSSASIYNNTLPPI